MELSALERDVLGWIAARSNDPALKSQLQAVNVVSREFTGCGSFTDLRPADASLRTSYREVSGTQCPQIESPDLEYGGGAVVFFEDGIAAKLELYSYGDTFPPDLREWRLLEAVYPKKA